MQLSANYNSINVFQMQSEQKNNLFAKETMEDHNLTQSENQANLYEKEDHQKDEMTFLHQGGIFHNVNPSCDEDSSIQVFVQTPNGRILSLGVNNNVDYLEQITDYIQQKEGIPPKRQKLYLGPKILDKINSKTIKKNSTLHLKISSSNSIIVVYNNQRHFIDINLNECVRDIKFKLLQEYEYPFHSQLLIFKNRLLKDDFKLHDYKIQKHSVILLKLKNFIYINQASKNRRFMRNLEAKMTIKEFKKKLQSKYTGLGDFHLLYRDQILKDEKELQFYNIADFSNLELVEKQYIKFSININNIKLEMEKEQYETIIDIKKEIQSQLEYPVFKQHLFYKGIELENDVRIIKYKIEEDSKLFLFNNLKQPYEIVIVDDFDDFVVNITLNDKIYALKNKICESQSLLFPNAIHLFYHGRLLKDNKDLAYYNIQNYDFISMEYDEDF
ncbi:unnamed protein product (macronuclear) [Paramecium tetraurelia]|uniref:Ubiquitin-like domain-containing protein n=1 Tax=Paramecium tetraurelia TaxID=5888 RepID=A0DJC7_PARTE|nr:uncharacterized protein GSPATT00017488001 [Paramecium tetraurelia]CAK83144.1 unnamed protein product [Paramecium tetraurelia]|eukprot:XP_001450541.1 hypothetical protein (macronuclear) [Paramecium tetraurelia strain d4-2]